MTAIWGPLGWLTLHSISVCYPNEPTLADKTILNEYMNAFGITIACPSCNSHFSTMFDIYKRSVPTWNNSKQDLFIAICKMHNSVNTRLNKPIPKTIEECLDVLKNSTKYSPSIEFRKKYIEYLYGQWRRSGLNTLVDIIKRIDNDYWSIRETNYNDVKFDNTIETVLYSNQPKSNKIVFPTLNLRNIRWSPQ